MLRLCTNVNSTEDPHPTRTIGQKEPRLISGDKMIPPVMSRSGQNRNHLARICVSLFSQFRRQQMWHQAQMEGLELKILMYMFEHRRMRDLENLGHRPRGFKWIFI
jgi:hypothetical protein